MREGEPADAFYVDPPTARSRSRPSCPRRGRGDRSRRCTTATCSAGRGSCRPTATPSTPARSATTHAIAFDGACLRGKCEADPALGYELLKLLRGGDRRAPPGHAAAAARRLRRRAGDALTPTVPALPRRRQAAARRGDTWTLRLEPADGDAAAPLRARAVRDALRVRRGRGADLGQRRSAATARSCTRSAPSARSPRRSAPREPGDVLGVRGPVRHRLAAGRGRGPRRGDRRRRHRPRAAAPGRPRAARAPRALRRGVVLYGGRSPDELLYLDELERWRGRFDVEVDVTVDARRRRLARARRASSPTLIPRARLRPRAARRDGLRPRGDDALRGRGAAASAGCADDRIWLSLERNMKCAHRPLRALPARPAVRLQGRPGASLRRRRAAACGWREL